MTQHRSPGRALVTGMTGFLGKALTARLDAAGWEVWGIGRRERPEPFRKRMRYVRCDLLRSSASVKRIVAEVAPGAVVHLAAAVPGRAGANAWGLVERNARMTAHLLSACEGLPRPPRVLLVSSSAVYGPGRPGGAISERRRLRPVNFYGVSKAMVEMLGSRAAAGGLPVVCARLFNLAGPGQGGSFVVPAFMRTISAILAGEAPPEMRIATSDSARDFVDVRDAAAGIALLLKRGEAGDVYNVCSGRAVKVREVLGALLRLAGLEGKVRVSEWEGAEDLIPYQRGSLAKIQALGWRPRLSLEKSLSDAWKAWCGKDA